MKAFHMRVFIHTNNMEERMLVSSPKTLCHNTPSIGMEQEPVVITLNASVLEPFWQMVVCSVIKVSDKA